MSYDDMPRMRELWSAPMAALMLVLLVQTGSTDYANSLFSQS